MSAAGARILIADGSPAAASEENVRFGGRPYGPVYADALARHHPDLDFFVLGLADGERLPQGVALGDFDGVAITGSPLSVYDPLPEVTRQIDFARSVFEAGIPCFGSCWGLQVMTVALGGEVRANPKGYEIGFARRISMTEAGRNHAMLSGKRPAYDAVAIHRDEVVRTAPGTVVLAANEMSEVQAAEISDGDRNFWGVQYHPEFDLSLIAAVLSKLEARLVADGKAATPEDVRTFVQDLRALHADPSRRDIAWRYGLGDDVLDAKVREREFANWLSQKVARRARGPR